MLEASSYLERRWQLICQGTEKTLDSHLTLYNEMEARTTQTLLDKFFTKKSTLILRVWCFKLQCMKYTLILLLFIFLRIHSNSEKNCNVFVNFQGPQITCSFSHRLRLLWWFTKQRLYNLLQWNTSRCLDKSIRIMTVLASWRVYEGKYSFLTVGQNFKIWGCPIKIKLWKMVADYQISRTKDCRACCIISVFNATKSGYPQHPYFAIQCGLNFSEEVWIPFLDPLLNKRETWTQIIIVIYLKPSNCVIKQTVR